MSYDDNTSNRLLSYTDSTGPNKSLSYDWRGNVTALGGQSFVYDLVNQPITAFGDEIGVYVFGAHHQ